jgi:hypothetical protein
MRLLRAEDHRQFSRRPAPVLRAENGAVAGVWSDADAAHLLPAVNDGLATHHRQSRPTPTPTPYVPARGRNANSHRRR